MLLTKGQKLKNYFSAFVVGVVFLFVLSAQNALATSTITTYQKQVNGTLESTEWNGLITDFVNTWLPATMVGPLGIGTSSQVGKLNVAGSGIYSAIFTNGSVGIGLTNPSQMLHVNGAGQFDQFVYGITPVNVPAYKMALATVEYVNSALATSSQNILDAGFWKLSGNSLFASSTAWNLGIGTSTPAYKLSVAGQFYSTSAIFGSNPTYSTTITDAGINFNNTQQTVPATYPSSQKGFSWNISSDGAWMKVYEAGSDALEYEFGMRDNVGPPDRFVWKLDEWRGVYAGLESLVLQNGTSFQINQPAYHQGNVILQGPKLATRLLANRVDSTLGAQATSVIRNNQTYWNADVGASTLVMTPNASGFTGLTARSYIIKIKNSASSPNTFSWGVGAYNADINTPANWIGNDIPVSTSPITLDTGVTITFNATTGGVAGESFGFTVLPGANLAGNSTGNSYLMGNLGIGTSNPFTFGGTAKLSVNASAPFTFGLSNTDAVYLRRNATGQYQLQTTANGGNNGDLLLQSYGGNVGIGTTTPAQLLHVAGTAQFDNIAYGITPVNTLAHKLALATVEYVNGYVSTATSTLASSTGKFIGATPDTYTGSNNSNPGYAYANNICATTPSMLGSHVCTTAEILNTILVANNSLPSEDVWIFSGPPGFNAMANDCIARTSINNDANTFGAIWQGKTVQYPEGRGLVKHCNEAAKLACCK